MNAFVDKLNVIRYHKFMIQHYENQNYRALGWSSPEAQLKRFDVLSQIADLNNLSVLDAGCGHADLLDFLRARHPYVRYFGVDQISEFVDLAVERHRQFSECLFYTGDFLTAELPSVDYVLLSGSLNYCNSDPEFIYKAINKLYVSARFGMGFNLLSHAEDLQTLAVYDPQDVLAYCKTLSPKVKMTTGYLKDDFTVFMYRNIADG